ncbi:MAG: AAA family ATPase [Leptospirales bacterium]
MGKTKLPNPSLTILSIKSKNILNDRSWGRYIELETKEEGLVAIWGPKNGPDPPRLRDLLNLKPGTQIQFSFGIRLGLNDQKKYGHDFWIHQDSKEINRIPIENDSDLPILSENSKSIEANPLIESNKTNNGLPHTRESLKQLQDMIGLQSVKDSVSELIAVYEGQRFRQSRGVPGKPQSLHTVFYGNPGTGKTTVARLLGKIYFDLGIVSKGHVIEVDRSKLVGQYVGHTAQLVIQQVNAALGGILFVDEAYSLAPRYESDFGREAIETLLKSMEDYRDQLIVIVAGYKNEMKDFLKSNPGLKSRFTTYLDFEDFGETELFEIFQYFLKEDQFELVSGAIQVVKEVIHDLNNNRGEHFGNARDIRNLYEKIKTKTLSRLGQEKNISQISANLITTQDVSVGYETYKKQGLGPK